MKSVHEFMVEVPHLVIDDTVTKARQLLRDDIYREIYVVDHNKKIIGYIDISDVIKVVSTKSNVTVGGFIKDAAFISPSAPIEEAAKRMILSRTYSAAITDNNCKFLGGVLLSDIFAPLVAAHSPKNPVSRCMTKQVTSASPEDPVSKMYTLITESGYTAFPITRKGEVVGIISLRDLLKQGRLRGAIERKNLLTVEDVMTKQVITISPEAPLLHAVDLLVQHDLCQVPVVESGKIVGIIDRHDILKSLALH